MANHTELSEVSDFMTKHGAGILADHINNYWAERGYVAEAERYELPGCTATWGVRSSMVNGWPTKTPGHSK